MEEVQGRNLNKDFEVVQPGDDSSPDIHADPFGKTGRPPLKGSVTPCSVTMTMEQLNTIIKSAVSTAMMEARLEMSRGLRVKKKKKLRIKGRVNLEQGEKTGEASFEPEGEIPEGKIPEMDEVASQGGRSGELEGSKNITHDEDHFLEKHKNYLKSKIGDLQRKMDEMEEKKGEAEYEGPEDDCPFVEDLMRDEIPPNFKSLTYEYDGTADPQDHLSRFRSTMLLYRFSEGVKCRLFATTLSGGAQKWYDQLGRRTVHSFKEFCAMFLSQFPSARKQPRTALSLMQMRQGESESLRSYIKRFSSAALEAPSATSDLKVNALSGGLKDGEFYVSLIKKPAQSFEELLSRAGKFINLEEGRQARTKEVKRSVITPKRELPVERIERDRPRFGGMDNRKRNTRYTPLTLQPAELLQVTQGMPQMRFPHNRARGPFRPASGNFCRYHNEYGHNTNDCLHLKDEIERLIQAGHLKEFVFRERTTVRPFRPALPPGRIMDKGKEVVQEPETRDNSVKRGFIQMIVGGPFCGDSSRARKSYTRSLRVGRYKDLRLVNQLDQGPTITFGPQDIRQVARPHDDALVIKANIGGYDIHRVFMDNGSSADVIFWDCYKQMNLEAKLLPVETSLHGFGGGMAQPMGQVALTLLLGEEKYKKSMMVNFLVVDLPSSYNVILGRPVINLFQAVPSTYHQRLKFPVGNEIGVVSGDQEGSRRCYESEVKTVIRKERNGEGNPLPGKRAKMIHQKAGTEAAPSLQPGDEVMLIELYPDKAGYTTRVGTQLEPEVTQDIIQCLRRNVDLFAFQPSDMTGVHPHIATHHLNVDPKFRPVKQKLRRFGVEHEAVIKEEVDKLVKSGHIVEVQFPSWLSNVVLAAKGNGGWRMCVDFRDLNKACPKDHYPLPRIDQLVDSTAGYEVLSMMDAYQGYHQIQLSSNDVDKVCFVTPAGTYGYKRMPFGLKNAGATYQRMVDSVFKAQIGRNMEVYVDDMLIKSARSSSHVRDMEETFQTIRRSGMKLNPTKCTFGVRSGKFLGYMVTQRGIEVNPTKVKAILDMQPPRNVKEVQSLTGRVAALSRFISRSAEKGLPFFQVLRKGCKFQWDEDCQKAFQDLKNHLTKLPLLTKPLPGETLYLYFAVSNHALSSVLIREEGILQTPIYYVSKMIQGAEIRYTDVEKAALTVMVTARRLRPYFLSHKVLVRTNFPLKQTLSKPDLSGRMVKWAVELGEYDVDFEPRTAIKAQALADFIVESTRQETLVWELYADGSKSVNGCGVGILLIDPQGERLQFAVKFAFEATHNDAEYESVIRGLQMALEIGVTRIHVYSDSQIVVKQVSGEYEIRDPKMVEYAEQVKDLASKFVEFKLIQVERGNNEEADALAKVGSSVLPGVPGQITVLTAEGKTKGLAIESIEEVNDWRTPIIKALTSADLTEQELRKKYPVKYCLKGDQLFRRGPNHISNVWLRKRETMC